MPNDSMISDYQLYDYDEYWYDYDTSMSSISTGELVMPLLVYSITFTIGLVGNILILVAVKGRKKVNKVGKLFIYSVYSVEYIYKRLSGMSNK